MLIPIIRVFASVFYFVAVLATACLPASNAVAQGSSSAASLVILVRHADKAPSPADDPGLTPAGLERAHPSNRSARRAVSTIITTQYRRTRETAQPLADQQRITPEIVSVGSPAELGLHIAALVATVRRHAGETIVVVGHSNTIPPLIAALGGPSVTDICEASYGRLFILASALDSARLVEARYGAPDPSPGRIAR